MDAPESAPQSRDAAPSAPPRDSAARSSSPHWADVLNSKELRCLPRWVLLCAVLLLVTLLVALVDAGSLAIWLSTRRSATPMSLAELSGLAATWGLVTAAPWAGLVGAVVSSSLWRPAEKTIACLTPLAVFIPVALIRPAPAAAMICSALLAALALGWLIVTGARRAYRPSPVAP